MNIDILIIMIALIGLLTFVFIGNMIYEMFFIDEDEINKKEKKRNE